MHLREIWDMALWEDFEGAVDTKQQVETASWLFLIFGSLAGSWPGSIQFTYTVSSPWQFSPSSSERFNVNACRLI